MSKMEEQLWHKHKWPELVKKSIKPYPTEPLYKVLENTAEKSGDFPYTVFKGVTSTYNEINDASNRIANFLVSNGVKKGDKVAIFLPNLPHYPIAFFGILKAGAVAVTCNPTYTEEELAYQLKDSEAVMVFCLDHDNFTPTTYRAIKGSQVKKVVVCSVKEFLPKITGILGSLLGKVPKSPFYEDEVTVFYKDIEASYEPKKPEGIEIDGKEDLAMLIYTGGTTGVPKGVMLTHQNIYANILQLDEYIWLHPDDGGEPRKLRYGEEVYIGALPWYHSYGLTLTMLGGAYKAARVIPIINPREGKPPLSIVLEEITAHKVTVLHAVPTIYSAIVNIFTQFPDKYDLSSITGCGSGAAPLAPELSTSRLT